MLSVLQPSQSVQYSYISSSPSSTSHGPHPESMHLLVPPTGCSLPLWPVVEGAGGHNSGSKQHGYAFPLAKALFLICWVWSSATVADSSLYNCTSLPILCLRPYCISDASKAAHTNAFSKKCPSATIQTAYVYFAIHIFTHSIVTTLGASHWIFSQIHVHVYF